jgi:NAD(P)H-hydrate repair Nnr-like enzyme with NAD(P)H-hydrate dehydratase domain
MSPLLSLKALMIASVGWKSNGRCKPPDSHKGRHKRPALLFRTMEAINIIAISKKGKSRIGTKLTTAIVEQDHHDKLFVVWPDLNQCRWINKNNDPDFRIVED